MPRRRPKTLAPLYHASLGRASRYSGYINNLMATSLSSDSLFISEADVAEMYPNMLDAGKWGREAMNYEEYYFKSTRRNRAYQEINYPDLFDPHVLVGEEPILSDFNQIWASRINLSRQWGEAMSHGDLHGDDVEARLMIPVADCLNHKASCIVCGAHYDWDYDEASETWRDR